ncbi:polysaccharide biosynthesis/export family protein [Jiella sp. MQZ9-1]|uniref:Polysaccharide biosynthesis/export family protein n=1 Tax=Jiella flava TaxID=2816857 RepID=A0A939JW14_9HYPH|nr:polysaccharide biosynthesis/export family protein [Jiella flava]MBO0663034.1 polysaccharide biosynthesis/export family protein [Jiella flava]MCD2471453.1 polysaccharide biosynthesis/export family protein [Jiella flava]
MTIEGNEKSGPNMIGLARAVATAIQTLRLGRVLTISAIGLLIVVWGGRPLAAAAAAPAERPYQLSAGDVVSFDFLDDTLPASEITVTSDGTMNVPLIGAVPVTGMSLAKAKDAIRKAFVDRQLFIDPKFSLAITSFRPVYVLGAVRTPGSYPFQPLLTVEQAVALAGGQSTSPASTEDRIVAEAKLRGDLDSFSVQITREALAAARLRARLAGTETIALSDLGSDVRGLVDPTLAKALLSTEQRILGTDINSYRSRSTQLAAAIKEVKGALGNLDELVAKQKDTIASAHADLDRMGGLYKRGIKTLSDIGGLERDVTQQESHLLEIYNQMSVTRRELADLQRQFSDLSDTWRRNALGDLQTHQTEIARLLAARNSTQKQIALLGDLALEQTDAAATIAFVYKIRRRESGAFETLDANLDSLLAPGDTIVVTVNGTIVGRTVSLASAGGGRP